jgi:hypothetical protein
MLEFNVEKPVLTQKMVARERKFFRIAVFIATAFSLIIIAVVVMNVFNSEKSKESTVLLGYLVMVGAGISVKFLTDFSDLYDRMKEDGKEAFLGHCEVYPEIEAYRVLVVKEGREFVEGDLIAARKFARKFDEARDIEKASKARKTKNDILDSELYFIRKDAA